MALADTLAKLGQQEVWPELAWGLVFMTALAVLAVYFFLKKWLERSNPIPNNTAPKREQPRSHTWAWGLTFFLLVGLAVALGLAASTRWLDLDIQLLLQPLANWLLTSGLRLLLVIVATWSAIRVITLVVARLDSMLPPRKRLDAEEQRRLATLQHSLGNLLKLGILLVALIMVLRELGFDVSALLTAAGIGGLAISLGAQDLIKDYLNGFFLLAEDQLRVGDVVQISSLSGQVEQMTLRTVLLRSLDGTLHVIPNRQVTTVSNMTKSLSRYVIDVEVAYKENVDRVMAVLRDLGEELSGDPQFAEMILNPLEVLGVDKFGSSGVVIKTVITTKPLQQWVVGRELRRRIKNRFDELAIEIPFPHLSLYWGSTSQPAQVTIAEAEQWEKERGLP